MWKRIAFKMIWPKQKHFFKLCLVSLLDFLRIDFPLTFDPSVSTTYGKLLVCLGEAKTHIFRLKEQTFHSYEWNKSGPVSLSINYVEWTTLPCLRRSTGDQHKFPPQTQGKIFWLSRRTPVVWGILRGLEQAGLCCQTLVEDPLMETTPRYNPQRTAAWWGGG